MRPEYRIDAANRTQSGTNSVVRFRVSGNAGTNPKGRIYKDGDSPGGFLTVVVGSPTGISTVTGIVAGDYIVEFQNDEDGIKQLAKVTIENWINTCFAIDTHLVNGYEEGQTLTALIVSAAGIIVQHTVLFANPLAVVVDRSRSVSIDGGVNYKAIAGGDTASWTNSELDTLGLSNLVPVVSLKRNSNSCISELAYDFRVQTPDLEPLEAVGYVENETSAEANDGEIFVNASGGSGNYEYAWDDGPTTQNRSGLEAGTYQVTVTDTVTEEEVVLEFVVTEPQVETPLQGTLLEVPLLNDLQWVVDPITSPDDIDTFQGVDNMLLKDQRYGAYERTNYYQKVAITDTRLLQFYSDFPFNKVELFNGYTDELVKTFVVNLVEENLGVPSDHVVRIENHSIPGKSRIYFESGQFPFPISTGTTFQIINNTDGFNGTYTVVGVEIDSILQIPYILINRNYDIVAPTSNASARFTANRTSYNVYESSLDFNGLDAGCYYGKITANRIDDSLTKIAITEPISLKTKHKNTVLIQYRHFRNGFGLTWSTGYIGRIRIEGMIGHKRLPGGTKYTSRDSDYSLVQTAAKKTRTFLFETGMLPPYEHEKLSNIFDLNFRSINNVEVGAQDAYEEPEYIDKVLLSMSQVKVEGRFFNKVDNSGIGSINDGFLITETGFIKL